MDSQTHEAGGSRSQIFEVGYLLSPAVAEEQVAAEVQAIKSLIEKYDGAVITEDFPRLRPLAYAMTKESGGKKQKFDKAYFGWIKFESPVLAVNLIKENLSKNDKLVRFMVVETVRENTLAAQKVFKTGTEIGKAPKEEGAAKAPEAPAISQEELDKTIDNLVV